MNACEMKEKTTITHKQKLQNTYKLEEQCTDDMKQGRLKSR